MKLTREKRKGVSGGFTLVELLVTIAIIAILAVIGVMMTGRLMKKAKSAQCMQNLRDWSAVFAQSSQDNNGRLPTPENWAAISHQPYNPDSDNPGRAPFVDYWSDDIDEAFRVQLEKRHCPCIREGTTSGGNNAPTYLMNWRLSEKPRYLEINFYTLLRPEAKIVFIDGDLGCPLRLNNQGDLENWIKPAAKQHGGNQVNAIFADLHVEPVGVKDLEDRWKEYMLPTL